jgi:hypothetical protein
MTSAKSDLGIVVGVDESSGANTVRWAAHEAELRKIPLTLVRVGLMPASGPSARVWTTAPTLNELREQHADEAQQILSKAIKIVEDSGYSGDLPAINSMDWPAGRTAIPTSRFSALSCTTTRRVTFSKSPARHSCSSLAATAAAAALACCSGRSQRP